MIFDLKNNEPTITIEGVHIPEFRAIWEADNTEDKSVASQVLSYVYHIADHSSVYAKQSPSERKRLVRDAYLKDELSDEMKELMAEAIAMYKKLQTTPSMRLLTSARNACEKLSEYFDTIDFAMLDDRGKPVYSARDLSTNLEKIGKIVISLNELETIVAKEKAKAKQIRKDAKPSAIL